jgi:hypothetical protein
MYDLINNGAHLDDGLKNEQETQDDPFDIYGKTLFGHAYHPVEEATVMDDEDNVSMDVTEADPGTSIKKKSQRTGGCMTKEDRCIFRSWISIFQDPICGAEQQGKSY